MRKSLRSETKSTQKWLSEKQKSEDLTQIKKDIESLKLEAERAQRMGDYAKVSEIQYGKLREKEDELQKLELAMQNQQNELVKEEVTAENISEMVAKWTGIPVTKLLQSEINLVSFIFYKFYLSVF